MREDKERFFVSKSSTTLKQSVVSLEDIPFEAMKDFVLGKSYDLSLRFVSPKESQKLNRQFRNLNEPTDILSFPLDTKTGEIFIDLKTSREMARDFSRDPKNFVAFLFIHGLFHLKGMRHGSTMEKAEESCRKRFGV